MDQEILNKAKQWLTGNYDEKTKKEIQDEDIARVGEYIDIRSVAACCGKPWYISPLVGDFYEIYIGIYGVLIFINDVVT